MAKMSITLILFITFLVSCERKTGLDRAEGYWEINGTKLHYVSIGKGDPILVLHGGPGGNLTSKLDLVHFVPDYHWILFDQRGCGESERYPVDIDSLDKATTFFSIDHYIEDIEQIRINLGVEKITLLGHSWGGALAVFYAAAYPDRVKKLIVHSGGPVWPELRIAKKAALKERSGPEVNARIGELMTCIGDSIEIWDQTTLDSKFIEMISMLIPAYSCKKAESPRPIEIGRGGFWANQLTNRYINNFDRDKFAKKLAKLKAPTLITYGRCDPSPPLRQTYLRDAIPNSIMVVFNESGHNAHLEQPELFGGVLRAFLSDDRLPLEHYDGTASDLEL